MSPTGPIRFAAICTPSHRSLLERLARSLARVHPSDVLRVHVAEPSAFAGLPHPNVELVVNADIERLGVKRAKFSLYRDELRRGPSSTSMPTSSRSTDSTHWCRTPGSSRVATS
jgi:hypothetical protein